MSCGPCPVSKSSCGGGNRCGGKSQNDSLGCAACICDEEDNSQCCGPRRACKPKTCPSGAVGSNPGSQMNAQHRAMSPQNGIGGQHKPFAQTRQASPNSFASHRQMYSQARKTSPRSFARSPSPTRSTGKNKTGKKSNCGCGGSPMNLQANLQVQHCNQQKQTASTNCSCNTCSNNNNDNNVQYKQSPTSNQYASANEQTQYHQKRPSGPNGPSKPSKSTKQIQVIAPCCFASKSSNSLVEDPSLKSVCPLLSKPSGVGCPCDIFPKPDDDRAGVECPSCAEVDQMRPKRNKKSSCGGGCT